MSSISTIIISHNNKGLLVGCLESVKQQSLAPDEVIFVDNGSTDGSAKVVQRRSPYVKIIQNSRNLAFATACNQAIDSAKGEFILLLNNDLVLDRNFIAALLEKVRTDERIGIAGGKVLAQDARQIDSAGQFLAPSRKIIDRGYREIDRGQYDKGGYVFGIGASAALYRRSMLEDIREGKSYFDEDFGFFYEDMDLAWRAQKRGWKAYYVPEALAYHKRGATAKTEEPRPIFLKRYYICHLNRHLQLCAIRNRYLMILKNDLVKDILKNLPFILWHEIKQAFYLILFRPTLIVSMLKDRDIFLKSLRKRRVGRDRPVLRSLGEGGNVPPISSLDRRGFPTPQIKT